MPKILLQDEKQETQTELTELISKDPLAVTAAFSDLIVKQNEIMFKNAKQPQQPLEKPQKEPLSTTNPEDDEDSDEFTEFDPRYQFHQRFTRAFFV